MNNKEKRLSRTLCLQILFANDFSGSDFKKIVKNFFINKDIDIDEYSYSNDQINYASKLFKVTIENKDEMDKLIKKKLVNWEMDRLALMDRMILRMSLSEMLFLDEIPPKVSIAEAVEIAKEFSSEDSFGFVNGIMDSIYNEKVNSKENKSST